MYIAVCDDQAEELELLTDLLRRWKEERRVALQFKSYRNAALHTPEALPGIIEALLQEGYSFVPISQLLLSGEYTIDHTGRQCPASA